MSAIEKIKNLALSPPEALWAHIASALDEKHPHKTETEKLRDLTVPPPPEAWLHIEKELSNKKSTQ